MRLPCIMFLVFHGFISTCDSEHNGMQHMCDWIDDIARYGSHVQRYLEQYSSASCCDYAQSLWRRYMHVHNQEIHNIFAHVLCNKAQSFFDQEIHRIYKSLHVYRLAACVAAETYIPPYTNCYVATLHTYNSHNSESRWCVSLHNYEQTAQKLTCMLSQIAGMRYWLEYGVPYDSVDTMSMHHNSDLLERYRLFALDYVQRAQTALRSIHKQAATENDQLNGYIIALHQLTPWDVETLSSLHNQSISYCYYVATLARTSHSMPTFSPVYFFQGTITGH